MSSLLKGIEDKIDQILNTSVTQFKSIDQRLSAIESILGRKLGSEISLESPKHDSDSQPPRKRNHLKDTSYRTCLSSNLRKRFKSSLGMSLRPSPRISTKLADSVKVETLSPPANDSWNQDSDRDEEKVSVSLLITEEETVTDDLVSDHWNEFWDNDKDFKPIESTEFVADMMREVNHIVSSDHWNQFWDYDKKDFKPNSINKLCTELMRETGLSCVFKHSRKYISEGQVPFIVITGECRTGNVKADKCTVRSQFSIDNEPQVNNDVAVRLKLRGDPSHTVVSPGIPSVTQIVLTADQWSEFWDYSSKSFKKNWTQLMNKLMNSAECPLCSFHLSGKSIREDRAQYIVITGGCRLDRCKVRIKFTVDDVPQPEEDITTKLTVTGTPTHEAKPQQADTNKICIIIPPDQWGQFWDYNSMTFKKNWTQLVTGIMNSAECPLCNFQLSHKSIQVGRPKFIVIRGGCRTECCKVRVKLTVSDIPQPDIELPIELLVTGIPTHPAGPDQLSNVDDVEIEAERWSELWDYDENIFKPKWSRFMTEMMRAKDLPFCLFQLHHKFVREGRKPFMTIRGGCARRNFKCPVRLRFTVEEIPQINENVSARLRLIGTPTHTDLGLTDFNEANDLMESKTCTICKRQFSSAYHMQKHWRAYHDFLRTLENQELSESGEPIVLIAVTNE